MRTPKFEWSPPKLTRNSRADDSYLLRFTVNGKYYRIRSGHCINRPDLVPNQHKGNHAKKQWSILQVEIVKLLERGINPMDKTQKKIIAEAGLSLGNLFQTSMNTKIKGKLSDTYKTDIENRGNRFLLYLKEKQMFDWAPDEFTENHARGYMAQYEKKSETYFNNIKRSLAVIFSFGVEQGYFSSNPFINIKLKRTEEKRNVPFSKDQLSKLMIFMEEQNLYNLMLVGQIEYFSLLRPHREIRLLKRSDFNEDLTRIILPGTRTKNKKVRSVPVGERTTRLLDRMNVRDMHPEDNIFTGRRQPYGKYYFNTQFARFREKDKALAEDPNYDHEQIMIADQTLYSFRHSGAIAYYKQHQDIEALRRAFSHSTIKQTESYLRNMGMLESSSDNTVPDWGS